MAVRDSAGLYLEVLESAPAAGVPIEFSIFDGANPATMLAAMQLASEGGFQPIFCETGAGAFTIPRDDPKAAYAIPGNLVRCKLGGIDRFAFWVEEPVAKLTSRSERGGETIVVQGRGAAAYLERASVYPPTWPVAAVVMGDSTSADNGSADPSIPTKSVSALCPIGVVSGDVLLTVLTWTGGDTRHVTAAPVGWTLVDASTSGSDIGVAVYVRRAGSGEKASWSWVFNGATQAIAQVVRLANASADVTAYALSSGTGTGTAIAHPSVGVGLVNGVLLTIAATATATTFTPPGSLAEIEDHNDTGRTAAIAYVLDPSLGDTLYTLGPLVSTAGASAAWMGITLFIPSSATNDWTFAGATFGAIMSTLVDAAQSRGALPFLTYDFTAEVDSAGQPWPDTHELSFHVGTSLLDVFRHLVTLGLEGEVTPDLRLRLYVDRSRHFESTVILRKGRHFLGDVTKKAHGSARRTRALVEGAGGRLVEVPDPTAEADARMGRREGYLELSTSDDPTDLQIAGESTLELSRLEGEAIELPVVHGPTAEGHFEPWVDYREGDWISLDPAGDGTLETHRIVAISAEQNGADYGVSLSLNAIAMSREVRLRRLLDSIAGRSNGASGAGSSLSLGGAGGSGGAAASSKVAAVAGDTAGFLFDKLAVDATLTKALTGDTGARRVALSVAPGGTHPDLATHDALGLATDAELAAHAAAADPHPGYETTAEGAARITTHEGAADPHTGYQKESEKGAASGYASLGAGGLVPMAQLASGTPDGTKFVRDDGTLVTPASGGMTNPMTTAEDLIKGGASGAPARLGVGGAGQVLTVTAGVIGWAAPAGGSALTIEEVDGTPTVSATKLVLPNGTLGVVGTVATYTPASGGGSDLVQVASGAGSIIIPGLSASADIRVAGANDDEFDTTDTTDPMTGWTTLGTPTHDINSTAKSHYRVSAAAIASRTMQGIYKACPSLPFTMTAKMTGANPRATFNTAGIWIAEATPGKLEGITLRTQSGNYIGLIGSYSMTTPTGTAAIVTNTNIAHSTPIYLRIVVTSSTVVEYWYSGNGLIWTPVTTARNPGFTVGAVALAVMSESGAFGIEAIFDWVRFT